MATSSKHIPTKLCLLGDNPESQREALKSQVQCLGVYAKVPNRDVNGYPMWKHVDADLCIACAKERASPRLRSLRLVHRGQRACRARPLVTCPFPGRTAPAHPVPRVCARQIDGEDGWVVAQYTTWHDDKQHKCMQLLGADPPWTSKAGACELARRPHATREVAAAVWWHP